MFQVTKAPGEVEGCLCCLLLLAGELSLSLSLGLLALGAFFLGAVVQYATEFSGLGCLLLCLCVEQFITQLLHVRLMFCFSTLGGLSHLFQGVGHIRWVLCRGVSGQWEGRVRGVLRPQRCLVGVWCSVHCSVGGVRLNVGAGGGGAKRVLGFWR